MKIHTSFRLILGATALAITAAGARAQAVASDTDLSGGFLGQTYTGVELGYTHHVESAPSVLHRYGFVSSRPLPETRNVDAAFKYDYTRGTPLGADGSQHDAAIGFTGYLPRAQVTPFVSGDAGWAWAKAAGVRKNGFMYRLGAGVEMALSNTVALTPYVNFRETPRFHDREWLGGAKISYRANRQWSASFAIDGDEDHNLEFIAGIQRRF